MVNHPYGIPFGQRVLQLKTQRTPKKRQYQYPLFDNELCQQPTHQLLKQALTHRNKQGRLDAIQQLGRWAQGQFEMDVLGQLAQHEPDLQLQLAAKQAIDQIRTRRVSSME